MRYIAGIFAFASSQRTPLLFLYNFLLSTRLLLAEQQIFQPLFPKDGPPEGWTVRAWSDISKPGPKGAKWIVENETLNGGGDRGSWLISEKDCSDFELHFEFKLGAQGKSGCALRSPAKGDPAFDGLELQMADLRYNLEGGSFRTNRRTLQGPCPKTTSLQTRSVEQLPNPPSRRPDQGRPQWHSDFRSRSNHRRNGHQAA